MTHSLTNSCLVDLIDVTLACKDANSKFVEVVIVADVDDEDRVGNSLLQIWKMRFGAELNPRVRCAFGNVFTAAHITQEDWPL